MAEVVTELQERMLPEYEQLKKFGVCTDEQIRDCVRKRESFQLRITQGNKSIRDYGDFIIFEKQMHKWVTEKESVHGTKLTGLKASIASRIIRLYREGIKRFPYEERFWIKFIKFCKKSVPHEVLGIYEKMLTYHGDKPYIWSEAALWVYEYSTNIDKVKEIFFRGLQRHPESEVISKAFFDILVMEAAKMSANKTLTDSISEQDIGLECVEIFYRNSKKKITNIAYFLSLIERCEEEKYKNMTARLQKTILEDLMELFPREERLWDALAQRELCGFNMCDLKDLDKKDNLAQPVASISTTNEEMAIDETEPSVDKKDPNLTSHVWQKRTLKRRIELCCIVYQTAVHTLQTQEMWILYINAMLKLNQDMSTQQVLKRKSLATAFKEGHESGLMSVDHYCTFVRMLLESPGNDGIAMADTVLSKAVEKHKVVKLFQLWLSAYIEENDEPKVYEIFRKADSELGAQALPIWRLTLQFYRTRYEDCFKRMQQIFKEACQKMHPDFGVLRGEYLEFCMVNFSFQETRNEYAKLCRLPPPCLALHQKMALLESQLSARSNSDLEHWRLCHENATQFFGKTRTDVWIDYIKFERDHGDPKRMSTMYQRAINTLDTKLVDNFISEHAILTSMI